MQYPRRSAEVLRLVSVMFILWVVAPGPARGQSTTPSGRWAFLPGRSPIPSPIAADQEPRLGLVKEAGSSNLTIDIGGTIDLVGYLTIPDSTFLARLGADFFATALSTSISGHRLQIDAVDGFFGGHVLCSLIRSSPALALRLRIIHRSAHFVDGHFDTGLNIWRGGRDPIPFTKDFGDLLASCSWSSSEFSVSLYSGVSYTTFIRPGTVRRVGSLHGIELRSGSRGCTLFGRPFVLFAAENLSIDAIPVSVGTNTLMAGVKFGRWAGEGIRLFAGYRSGLEPFGQYYDVRRHYWTLGVLFDV